MIKKIDAFIQKHFDACVHALMRKLGVTKRIIRNNIYIAMIVSACFSNAVGKHPSIGMCMFLTIAYGLLLLFHDREDRKVEESNFTTTSFLDSPLNIATNKWYGFFIFMLDIIILSILGTAILSRIVSMVFDAAWLSAAYLGATKPQAPKKQEDTQINLVPSFES